MNIKIVCLNDKITENKAYIIGSCLGDSIGNNKIRIGKYRQQVYCVGINCGIDRDFAENFTRNLETEYKVKPKTIRNKNSLIVYTHSKIIWFDIRKYATLGSKKWLIKEELFNVNDKNIIFKLLQGIFDAEGFVFDGGIKLECINRKGLKQIKTLLDEFEIKTTKICKSKHKADKLINKDSEAYYITIGQLPSIIKFKKMINFSIKRKKEKLNKIIYRKINSKCTQYKYSVGEFKKVFKLAKLGWSANKIAKKMKISPLTIRLWLYKKQMPYWVKYQNMKIPTFTYEKKQGLKSQEIRKRNLEKVYKVLKSLNVSSFSRLIKITKLGRRTVWRHLTKLLELNLVEHPKRDCWKVK